MKLSFTSCQAVSWDVFYVRGSRDDADPFAPFSRVLQYARGQQREGRDWAYDDYPFASNDMTLYRWDKIDACILCVLGEPGLVVSADREFEDEHLIAPDRAWQEGLRLGRLTRIRQIGGELYAAGEGGQTYRRADGAWEPLDPSFFRPKIDPNWQLEFIPADWIAKRMSVTSYIAQHPAIADSWADRLVEVYRDDLIYGINGPHEEAIYICGKDGLLAVRTDDGGFQRLPLGTEARLLDIAVMDEERILVCGEQSLLIGNHRNGFKPATSVTSDLTFRRMAVFGGKVYLAAADGRRSGLYVFDDGRIEKVKTGLSREIGSLAWLSATDEMLLAVGHKEIVRFDGKTWDRVDFPGNN